MADPEVRISIATEDTGDVEMDAEDADGAANGGDGGQDEEEPTEETAPSSRTAFVE